MIKNIANFCMKTEKITKVIDLFEKNFTEEYKKLKSKHKKNLFNYKDSIFRHWYYSSLVYDDMTSPANYINAQIQKKFGDEYTVVPHVNAVLKGNRISKFDLNFKFFSLNDHPVVNDLKTLIEYCIPSVQFHEEDDMLIKDCDELLDNLNYRNMYYLVYLTQVAYELRLLKDMPSLHVKCAQITNKTDEFFELSKEEQFEKIFDASINVSYKMLSHFSIAESDIFTREFVLSLLENDMSLDSIFNTIYSKLHINIDSILDEVDSLNMDEIEQFACENKDIAMLIASRTVLDIFFDTWFISVFGYYLQVIQPINIDFYDFELEFEDFCDSLDEMQPIESSLFTCPDGYDLTPIGEKIISKYKNIKNTSNQKYDDDDNFDEIFEDIIAFDEDDEDDENDDFGFGLGLNDEDAEYLNIMNSVANAMIKDLEKQAKKNSNKTSNDNVDIIKDKDKVYCFKVKDFYNKRHWKMIEIKGNQTLEDLHDTILDVFDLELGHMYSFFMNNKAWDPNYEYTAPQADHNKKTTDKAKIYKLELYLKQKFVYIYDFGDEITFEIQLMKVHDIKEGVKYPVHTKSSKN